jgi:hypothetical protein
MEEANLAGTNCSWECLPFHGWKAVNRKCGSSLLVNVPALQVSIFMDPYSAQIADRIVIEK